jgi:hypothetical protein
MALAYSIISSEGFVYTPTPHTQSLLAHTLRPSDDPAALAQLARLPSDVIDSDRIITACLKVSQGRLERLIKAVDLTRTDWRDLPVGAGFADDPDAHLHWQPPTDPHTKEPRTQVRG